MYFNSNAQSSQTTSRGHPVNNFTGEEMNPERKQEPADYHFRSGNKMATPCSGTSRRLVQYVIVRSDLIHTLSWPLGAVITQACHAATAAIHLHYSDPDTQEYLAELDSMHKVVLQVSTAITSYAPSVSDPLLAIYRNVIF